jgi:hypothetical protein
VLAREVVWIGRDMQPIRMDDRLFQAIPELCDQLAIKECMLREPETEFAILHTHFKGMANSRFGDIEATRIMELLGNRKATVPVDEVYGIMSASTVEIDPIKGETKEEAWERWCEAAVLQGHVRWLMLPPAPFDPQIGATSSFNCALPCFSLRHDLSSASYLDSVTPFEPVAGNNGTFALTGRYVGSCQLIRRLGSTHCSKSGLYHRDITLILFSRGNWHLALQVARAFGGGRYNRKQLIVAAQVMANNYARACLSIRKEKEEEFSPVVTLFFQARVWDDLMQLQERCMMDLINISTRFCAMMSRTDMRTSITTVVVTNGILPAGELHCIDFNAVAGDRRRILMVIEAHGCQPESRKDLAVGLSKRALHKFGTTLPISDDYDGIWSIQPMTRFNISGSDCEVCSGTAGTIDQPPNSTPGAPLLIDSKRLKAFLRREKLVSKAVSGGTCRIGLFCRRMSGRTRGVLVLRIR